MKPAFDHFERSASSPHPYYLSAQANDEIREIFNHPPVTDRIPFLDVERLEYQYGQDIVFAKKCSSGSGGLPVQHSDVVN